MFSSVPLYSATIARPDGNLVTFVRVTPSFANIAVPRIEDSMLWCVSYPSMFVVYGLVTSCAKRMSMSYTHKTFSNVSTLALVVMPLILIVAILIVSIFPLRGGVGVGGLCYSALYLWLVVFMYRASGLAAFSFGRLISEPMNGHFFSLLGWCLVCSLFPFSSVWTISISDSFGLRPALLCALCRMATFLFVLISSSFGF